MSAADRLLAAAMAEIEKLNKENDEMAAESIRAHVEYKRRRNEQFVAYESLHALNIRLRAGIRDALELGRRIALGVIDSAKAQAEMAEIRSLLDVLLAGVDARLCQCTYEVGSGGPVCTCPERSTRGSTNVDDAKPGSAP